MFEAFGFFLSLRNRFHAGTVEVHLVELVAETLELEGCTDAEHYLDCAGKDVECLYCLCLDVLVLDEGSRLLCATEEDVHDLLCV